MKASNESRPSRFQIQQLEERIAPQASGSLLGEINKDDPLTTGSQDRDATFGQTYCASEPHPGGERAETLGLLFG